MKQKATRREAIVRSQGYKQELIKALKKCGGKLIKEIDGITYKYCFKHKILEDIKNFKKDPRTKTGYSKNCIGEKCSNGLREIKNGSINGRLTKNPLSGLTMSEIEARRDAFLNRKNLCI